MILPFKTQINGKPTYFVEKIFKGIKKAVNNDLSCKIAYEIPPDEMLRQYSLDIDKYHEVYPKIHTIREDKNNRWKAGVMIDFFINTPTKDMLRFAPTIPVVSIQTFEIKWYNTFGKKIVRVFIDDKSFACVKFDVETIITGKILELAKNDGFDTIEDFFANFNKDFKGKIIHWTDKRY